MAGSYHTVVFVYGACKFVLHVAVSVNRTDIFNLYKSILIYYLYMNTYL